MADVNVFASVLPGRIRLRHPLLRDAARHRDLLARLRVLGQVDGDLAIGSLLLRFDPADSGMLARVQTAVAAVVPPAPPSVPAVHRHSRHRALKWRVNRAAKVGAVAGMALSLAALRFSKRLHVQAGAASVALMLVHMAVHWRRTFK